MIIPRWELGLFQSPDSIVKFPRGRHSIKIYPISDWIRVWHHLSRFQCHSNLIDYKLSIFLSTVVDPREWGGGELKGLQPPIPLLCYFYISPQNSYTFGYSAMVIYSPLNNFQPSSLENLWIRWCNLSIASPNPCLLHHWKSHAGRGRPPPAMPKSCYCYVFLKVKESLLWKKCRRKYILQLLDSVTKVSHSHTAMWE